MDLQKYAVIELRRVSPPLEVGLENMRKKILLKSQSILALHTEDKGTTFSQDLLLVSGGASAPLAVLQTCSMTDTYFTPGSNVGGIVMFWDTAHKSDGWLFTEAARNITD